MRIHTCFRFELDLNGALHKALVWFRQGGLNLGLAGVFDRVPLGFRYGIDGVQIRYQMVLRNCFRSGSKSGFDGG